MRSIIKLLGIAGLLLATQAGAAPPAQVRQQAPGYQRLAVGDYEVTALFDGYNDLSSSLLKGLSPAQLRAQLASRAIDDERMPTSFNAFLVNTGKHLVMIDSGLGQCAPETAGQLVPNIVAAGYEPGQVDTIFLTHLHLDHVCGLVDTAGKPLFPNAIVYVAQREAQYWLDAGNKANAPADARIYFDVAQRALAPYQAAGHFQTFAPPQAPIPEVMTAYAIGHTPGSTVYRFASKGTAITFIGDLIHSAAVQFDHPEVAIRFDADAGKAVAARARTFDALAHDGEWLAAAHLPFPGMGRVTKTSKRYNWVPVLYGPYQRAAQVPLLK